MITRLELEKQLGMLRRKLEPAFGADTAYPGTNWRVPSAGHCAVVAAIVQRSFGGDLISTGAGADEHWFNRIRTPVALVDVDLTADQFGRRSIEVGVAGSLYRDGVERSFCDLEPETLERASRLARRAGLVALADQFRGLGDKPSH